jgi:hypothetical protein
LVGEGFRVRVWMQLGGERERERGGGGEEGKRRFGAGASEETGDAERD